MPPAGDAQPMSTPFDDGPRQNLGEAALSGVRWVAYGRVVSEVANLAAAVVLARLIAPSQFGIVAIALIVYSAATILSSLGLISALVQLPAIAHAHLRTAMTMSLISSGLAAALVYFGAPLAAGVLGDAVVGPLQLTAPVFLILGMGGTSNAILQRRLEFGRLTIAGLLGSAAAIVVSLALAFAGLEAEALILGALARSVAQTAYVIWRARPPLPAWRRAEAHELWSFGAPTAAGSTGYLVFRHIDYVIVGAQLGLAQLGFYWRAYQMSFEHQHKVTDIMKRIAFPIFSRSDDLEHLRRMRFRVVRLHSLILFPAMFWLLAAAPDLIPFVYGPAWVPAVQPLQILALAGLAVPILAGSGPALLAAGFPRQLMYTTWIAAAGFAAVVFVAAPHGLTALCVAVAGYHFVKLALMQYLLMERLLGVTTRAVVRESAPALAGSVAVLAVSAATLHVAGSVAAPAAVGLPASLLLGGAVYLVAVRHLSPDGWADARRVVDRLIPSRLTSRLRGLRAGVPVSAREPAG